MGNNRSSAANIFHGNSPPSSIKKFWKKKSSKIEQHSSLKMENAILAQTMKGQTRRSSLNHQIAAKKQSTIFRSLRKSKSEKVNEVFGSSDLPLLNNDNDCAGSDMENSSGKQLITPIDRKINRHFVRSTVLNTGTMDRPPTFCSSASTSARFIHHQQEKTSSDSNRRRVKSFRHFPSTRNGMASIGNRAIISYGPISGLSLIQKKLILNRWQNFDRKNLFEICSAVFERFFKGQPQFALLHFCNQEQNGGSGIAAPLEMLWKSELRTQRSFQIHVERFSTVLFFALDGLEEENSTLDQLPMEYGASYASSNNNNSFPAQYWEFFRQCLIDQNSSEKTLMSLQHNPFIDSLDRPFSRIGSRRSFEAWIAFATFLVSKIRFGYEMERFLQKRFYRMTWNSEKEINGTLTAR